MTHMEKLKQEVYDLTYVQVRFFKMGFLHCASWVPHLEIDSDLVSDLVDKWASRCVLDAYGNWSEDDVKRLRKVRLIPENGEEYGIKASLTDAANDKDEHLKLLFQRYQRIVKVV